MFLLATSSLTGQDGKVPYPSATRELSYEAELAVVMGKRCFHVPEAEATRYIFGYTCANDVTARDLQRSDGQWTRAKGFDTFCPLGPWIDTDLDPADVVVDLSGTAVWDASSVATLDAIRTKYASRGKTVRFIGLDDASADRLNRLSGRLGI